MTNKLKKYIRKFFSAKTCDQNNFEQADVDNKTFGKKIIFHLKIVFISITQEYIIKIIYNQTTTLYNTDILLGTHAFLSRTISFHVIKNIK